jgi:hypothetical protein
MTVEDWLADMPEDPRMKTMAEGIAGRPAVGVFTLAASQPDLRWQIEELASIGLELKSLKLRLKATGLDVAHLTANIVTVEHGLNNMRHILGAAPATEPFKCSKCGAEIGAPSGWVCYDANCPVQMKAKAS